MKKTMLMVLALLLTLTSISAGAELALPAELEEIQEEAFAGDTEITEITVPEGTTSIGARAFLDCTALEMVHIPDSVTDIGEDAFSGCDTSILEIDCSEGSPAYDYAIENGLTVYSPVVYRALTVGERYADTSSELHGTVRDAGAIADALSIFDGTPYHVTRKTDLSASGILSAISSCFADADSNDVSLFYYSGHGVGDNGSSYQGALVGNDFDLITASALRRRLDTIPGRKIVLIDACFSGYLIGKEENLEDAQTRFVESFGDSFISAFSRGGKSDSNLAAGAYYVITAASGEQSSLEIGVGETAEDVVSTGLFTLCLTEGLGWNEVTSATYDEAYADVNSDGKISIDEAASYAKVGVDYIAGKYYDAVQSVQVYPDNCTDFYIAME